PNNLSEIVDREARSLVSEVDVKSLVKNAIPRAERLATASEQTLSTLKASESQINYAIGDKLVAEIRNSYNEPGARAAADKLVDLGGRVSQQHINELWSLGSGGYSTERQYLVAWHAAYVVGHIESPYVTPVQRQQARAVCGCKY